MFRVRNCFSFTMLSKPDPSQDEWPHERYSFSLLILEGFVLGTVQFCLRWYNDECFVNKIDLHCCCVVFFVV